VRLRVLECPRCGAPLPKRAALVKVVCEYCQSEITLERFAVKAAEYREALTDYSAANDPAILLVGKVPIRRLARLATGHSSDVWRAERATRLSERLVLKLLRAPADEGLLQNEQQVLKDLERSTQRGADYFTTCLPQRVAFGQTRIASAATTAAAFREPVGFAHTLSDLCRAFPHGVDARHIVWIWRRALEFLGWVHLSGKVHGAVLPDHLLINAPEHAVRLVGWSCAANRGSPLAVAAERDLDLYPKPLLNGGPLGPPSDLAMLARSLLVALGSRSSVAPAHVPEPLGKLLEREAASGGEDAWRLNEEVSACAKRCFGPPQFLKLDLP